MELGSLPLPEPFISVHKNHGIITLYPPQVACVEKGLLEGKNLLISIPTASGKTLLAEMAMWVHIAKGGKCLYIVPLRALAAEKFEEFKKPLIKVGIATGDLDRTDTSLGKNDIIVATSEKVDSLLRNRTGWLSGISCMICDEIHLIGSEHRGATLEMVITKMRYSRPDMQVIGLSATVGNAAELARWLSADLVTSNWRPVDLHQGVFFNGIIQFPDSKRPVKGVTKHDDLNLCLDTIEEGGQCLVFVSSRRNAEGFAKRAASAIKTGSPDSRALAEKLRGLRDREGENVLASCVERGTAFHHAGLLKGERSLIEEGFRNGFIEVISATPTLAAGLNLPARRVVIRDYMRFSSDLGMVPIPVMEYHQMAGRAGRPHLDPYGEAVLIAKDKESVETLTEFFIDAEPEHIDSQCAEDSSLHAHILSLIATGFANNQESLTSFMAQTFYSFQHPNSRSLIRVIEEAVRFLINSKMISSEGESLMSTQLGSLVSRLYLDPGSARTILDVLSSVDSVNLTGLLHLVCCSPNMTRLYLRSVDNQTLRSFLFKNTDIILLPMPYDQEGEEIWYTALKTALVLTDWAEELSEQTIEERYGIGAGDIHNVVEAAKWLLHATERLIYTMLPDRRHEIDDLVLRVRHGVKEELIPLVQLRNIGRVRARRLYNTGYTTPESLIEAGFPAISRILGQVLAKQVFEEITRGRHGASQTRWSEEDAESVKVPPEELTEIPGIGPKIAEKLKENGIQTVSDLLKTDQVRLAHIIGAKRAERVLMTLDAENRGKGEEPESMHEQKSSQWSIQDF